MKLFFIGVGIACSWSVASIACELGPRETGYVAAAVDTVSYELADGRELRLEGLGSPRAPAHRDGPWPILEEATDDARDLIGTGAISFAPTEEPDRYGRVIAQVWLEDGIWLNGALVERGLARAETTVDQRRCAIEVLALEATARANRRGMWRLSVYDVREGLETSAYTNDFQIVRGRIVEAAEVRGRIYLNFGTDWRTDFTVTIAPRDVAMFAEAGLDPLSWGGRAIRVRGWLEWYNGPMIEASHPEQIELLDAGAAAEAEGEPVQ